MKLSDLTLYAIKKAHAQDQEAYKRTPVSPQHLHRHWLLRRVEELETAITQHRDATELMVGNDACLHDKILWEQVDGTKAIEAWNTRAAPKDELAELEREIAEHTARVHIRLVGVDWQGYGELDVRSSGEQYIRYLELRGLLERHPDNPNLVRVKEESDE